MSRSESDAASSSGSDSSDDDEPMQVQPAAQTDSGSDSESDSGSESSSESSSESGSESGSESSESDSDEDDAAATAAAAAEAEREAKRQKRREANANRKAAKDATAAASTPATPARPASAPVVPASAAAVHKGPLPSSLLNKLIKPLNPDYYYHLGLTSALPLKAMFGDVRFVILSGSPVRAQETALKLQEALGVRVPTGCSLAPIGKTERYSLFKVGPVLSVSHGMGKPSISIMLHELTKMLAAAGVLDKTTYIRVGTSGGVGVEPGSVIVSSGTVNGALEPSFPVIILGKTVQRPCVIRPELVKEILDTAAGATYPVLSGVTCATDDFYEGQGRLDGAIAEYTLEDKMAFLAQCHARGIKNIEMESDAIVAFCTKLHIPCAVICAAIVNRLQGDQVMSTPAQLVQYTENAVNTTIRFIQHRLRLPKDAAQGKVKKALRHAQRDEAKIRAGGKAVPHVAGSGTEFLHSALTQPHTGAIKLHGSASNKAVPTANGASSKKKSKTPAQPQTPAKTAPNTPAPSDKKQKKNKKAAAAPVTPAPAAAPATPAPAAAASSKKKKKSKDGKVQAGKESDALKSVAKVLEQLEKRDKKAPAAAAASTAAPMEVSTPAASEKKQRGRKAKKEEAPAAAPAAAAPAAVAPVTPAKSDKKSKSDKKKEPKDSKPAAAAAPATPAPAAAAPASDSAAAAVGPNRREKKRLADEARAAAEKAAADKVVADAAAAEAQRASDLAKFDPDAAAFPKQRRPTKKEREAERERLAAAAAAAAGNGTPAKPDAKKRKAEDATAANGTASANGTTAAPAADGPKAKKARKEKAK